MHFMIALLFFILVIVGMIVGTVFWALMIIDCATKESDTGNDKLVWIIIIVFTHLIGALIYHFVRRPERRRELRRRAALANQPQVPSNTP